MKTVILGAAFASLLVATTAVAQTPRLPSFAQPDAPVAVPTTFALRDANVDLTASVPSPRSIFLGEFTVLQLRDKDVTLRFATLGAPPPPIPTSGPRGQALVTVGVDVIVLGRR